MVGNHGAFGPYWMVADLFFAVLLLLWVYDLVVRKSAIVVHAPPFLFWYGPFAVVATVSVFGTEEPVWALGDLLRIAKLGLVLHYFRYNVGPRQWWVIVAALGAAVTVQSLLAMLEVATGRTGVLGVFGLNEFNVLHISGIFDPFGGWTRATGTVAHPPYLAAFLLLTVPVFMSLALALHNGMYRWMCSGVALLGLVGLLCSLTRWPIAVMLVQAMMLLTALVALRLIPLTRAIALAVFAGLGLSIVALLGAEFIYDRMTRDFAASVDQRFIEYRVAANMLIDHPLFGVGLNNYAAHMAEYGSSANWGITEKYHRIATDLTHMRLLAGPLNGYLYVAVSTGFLGLLAFLWFAAGGLILAWRAIRARRTGNGATSAGTPIRAACVGMLIGMLGLYASQLTSYSIWVDTVIAVWTILIGLVGCAAGYALRNSNRI